MHTLQAAPSSAHSNVAPPSSATNVKPADVLVVEPDGPEVMVVSGATLSTVTVRWDEVVLLPARSVARAASLWVLPFASPAVDHVAE